MKPIKEIQGNLGLALKIGNRAVICCSDSTTLFTSVVVNVRNMTESGVEIETLNTIYIITFDNREECAIAV